MKRQTNPHEYFIDPTNCPWIFEDVPQGDEEVNKRIKQKNIYLNKLPSLFKYIFFCFILLFTSSSLAVRISPVAVSYFSKSLIVLIQVYRSTTGRSSTTHWFVAVDLLTFYIVCVYSLRLVTKRRVIKIKLRIWKKLSFAKEKDAVDYRE